MNTHNSPHPPKKTHTPQKKKYTPKKRKKKEEKKALKTSHKCTFTDKHKYIFKTKGKLKAFSNIVNLMNNCDI